MKRIIAVVFGLLLFVGVFSRISFAQDFKPEVVVMEPEIVFAPMGFDNNDNAQITLHGYFPDTCYKAGAVPFRIDRQNKKIYLKNQALHYTGCWCGDVLVPYTHTINLGILREGKYRIFTERADGSVQEWKGLPIAIATSASPDENLYAPIDHLYFTSGDGSSGPEIMIDGTFRNSCMYLKDIDVKYRSNRVIEILPIAGMKQENCVQEQRHFSAKIQVKESVHGHALIHVRSLNGQALNEVVEL